MFARQEEVIMKTGYIDKLCLYCLIVVFCTLPVFSCFKEKAGNGFSDKIASSDASISPKKVGRILIETSQDLYEFPDKNSKIILTLDAGILLEAYSGEVENITNKYIRVSYNEIYGWISMKLRIIKIILLIRIGLMSVKMRWL